MKRPNNTYKMERITSEIKRVVTEVVSGEIQDKRVCGNCEVTDIILSKDLSYCKVFVSISAEDKKEVLNGLKSASGFVRHIVAETLDLRKTPEFSFLIDETAEHAKRIEEILNEVKKTESSVR